MRAVLPWSVTVVTYPGGIPVLVAHLPTDLAWRKSTASGAQNDCVELAWLADARTGLRDSKSLADPAASALVVPASATAALVSFASRA